MPIGGDVQSELKLDEDLSKIYNFTELRKIFKDILTRNSGHEMPARQRRVVSRALFVNEAISCLRMVEKFDTNISKGYRTKAEKETNWTKHEDGLLLGHFKSLTRWHSLTNAANWKPSKYQLKFVEIQKNICQNCQK